jgi:ABC-type transporter Mla maintaining outer membrane lipid asymmetry ATPase subunit MlaF
MESAVELKGVRLSSEGYEILKDITVGFPKGRSTIIMGPSGCGKSTLLKAAAGIMPPDSGSVLVDGAEFHEMNDRALAAARKVTGFVFQDGALWENRTVYQNVAFPLEYHWDLSEKQIGDKVGRLLDRMGLADQASLRPAQLSTGERKAVSFCRGVIANPRIVFMDEPTLSVDRETGAVVLDMIRELKSDGRTLITVTHDPKLTSWLADYLVILRHGALVEAGEFTAVRSSRNPATQSVLADVMDQAAAYDTELLDLLSERPWSMEDS